MFDVASWEGGHEWSLFLVESSSVAVLYGLGHVHRMRMTNLSLNNLYTLAFFNFLRIQKLF